MKEVLVAVLEASALSDLPVARISTSVLLVSALIGVAILAPFVDVGVFTLPAFKGTLGSIACYPQFHTYIRGKGTIARPPDKLFITCSTL